MKICAQCNGTFEEGIAYCPKDGSRLTNTSKHATVGKPGAPPAQNSADASAPAPAEVDDGVEDLTGQTIAGRYKVLRRLGEGGMGVVYSAVDTRLEKEVAIKVLKEDFARRQDVVARFTQEAKSAARIKHENVLDVTDYGQTEAGSFYIAMELLVGTDLADVLQKSGTLDPTRAIAISIQVTRALQAAHGKGIVHRDLKPENVFLVPGGDNREVVKIVDFGIAQMKDLSGGGGTDSSRKLTRTGMIFGTPEYMSPEQAAGKSIDHRVDVYAVGVIMYEMLAGRVPFVGDTFMGILTQHMFEPVPPITSVKADAAVPPDLEAVIFKALAKDAAQRYQSMQELGDDLARLRDGQRPGAIGSVVGPPPARPDFSGGRNGSPTVPGTLTAKFGTASSSTPMDPVSHTIETDAPKSNRTMAMVGGLVALVLAAGGFAVVRSMGGNHAPDVAVTPPTHPTTPQGSGNGNGPNAANNNGTNGTGGTGANGNGAEGPALNAGPSANANNGAAAAVPDAGSAVPAPPSLIRVHIVSTPPRARVEVEGQNLLCQQTPCDLPLTRGQEFHLSATAPRRHGEATVTPQAEGETVTINLEPVAANTRERPSNGGGGNAGAARPAGGHRGSCGANGMRVDPGTGLLVPCFIH